MNDTNIEDWKDMSSAPRDGSEFYAKYSKSGYTVVIRCKFRNPKDKHPIRYDDGYLTVIPTQWSPIHSEIDKPVSLTELVKG
jgi:hypothetical protein